jgi:hypothetical protein
VVGDGVGGGVRGTRVEAGVGFGVAVKSSSPTKMLNTLTFAYPLSLLAFKRGNEAGAMNAATS